jgi:hypothetical protein
MTATGKPAQVAEALFEHLDALEPALPISFPEPSTTFNPPADGKYLDVAFLPNRPAWEGLTDGVLDQGLLQVTVVWPRNLGIIAPSETAAAVMAHFAKGTTLYNGGARIRVSAAPWITSPLSEDADVRIPVLIPWSA